MPGTASARRSYRDTCKTAKNVVIKPDDCRVHYRFETCFVVCLALFLACHARWEDAVKTLLDTGADINKGKFKVRSRPKIL